MASELARGKENTQGNEHHFFQWSHIHSWPIKLSTYLYVCGTWEFWERGKILCYFFTYNEQLRKIKKIHSIQWKVSLLCPMATQLLFPRASTYWLYKHVRTQTVLLLRWFMFSSALQSIEITRRAPSSGVNFYIRNVLYYLVIDLINTLMFYYVYLEKMAMYIDPYTVLGHRCSEVSNLG